MNGQPAVWFLWLSGVLLGSSYSNSCQTIFLIVADPLRSWITLVCLPCTLVMRVADGCTVGNVLL